MEGCGLNASLEKDSSTFLEKQARGKKTKEVYLFGVDEKMFAALAEHNLLA